MRHLFGLGHERIAFIADHMEYTSELERYTGYRTAYSMFDRPFDEKLCLLQSDMEAAADALAEQICSGNITALFVVNDRNALKVMEALMARGIRIPEDVSVVGFDDSQILNHAKVPLTTVKQYFDEIGLEASRLLFERMRNNGKPFVKLEIGTDLIKRESTGRNIRE